MGRRFLIGMAMMLSATTASADGFVPYNTIFLDRCEGGCLVSPGFIDSRTDRWSVSSTRSLPAFPHGDQVWADVVACVKATFAPFDAQVTDIDPGNAPHFEAKVAGTAAHLGTQGFDGTSSFQCTSPFISNNLVFAFAETIGPNPTAICAAVARQIGHTFTLDLASEPMDVMSTSVFSGQRNFVDAELACATAECACGGPTQNSYQMLVAAFGLAPVATMDAGVPPADASPDAPLPDAPPAAADDGGAGRGCTISYGANWVTILIAIQIALGARRRRR